MNDKLLIDQSDLREFTYLKDFLNNHNDVLLQTMNMLQGILLGNVSTD